MAAEPVLRALGQRAGPRSGGDRGPGKPRRPAAAQLGARAERSSCRPRMPFRATASPALELLVSWLAPARTRVSYPGVWLGDRDLGDARPLPGPPPAPRPAVRTVAARGGAIARATSPMEYERLHRHGRRSRESLPGSADGAPRRHRHPERARAAARPAPADARHRHGAGDGQAPGRADAPLRDARRWRGWCSTWASTPTGCCSATCTAAGRSATSRGPRPTARGWSTPARGCTSRCSSTAPRRRTPTGPAGRWCSRTGSRRAAVGLLDDVGADQLHIAPPPRGQRRMRWLSPNSCHR